MDINCWSPRGLDQSQKCRKRSICPYCLKTEQNKTRSGCRLILQLMGNSIPDKPFHTLSLRQGASFGFALIVNKVTTEGLFGIVFETIKMHNAVKHRRVS